MKIRLTRKTVIEYEPNPDNYDDKTPEGMLKLDLEACQDDPELMFNLDIVSDEVVGEIVE
jgi:hypothetical protein